MLDPDLLFMRGKGPVLEAQTRGNRCGGCIWCCIYYALEVPAPGEDGLPTRELVRKPHGELCPWLGPVEGGVLGCTIHKNGLLPFECEVFECPELRAFDGGV